MHYLASDGTFKDIDTNLRLDKSGAYYIIDSGLYNVAFTGNFTKGNWDVAYEVPRPAKEKFRDPGKPRPPVTRIRWKVLSYGYWEAQENRYLILEHAHPCRQWSPVEAKRRSRFSGATPSAIRKSSTTRIFAIFAATLV